LSIENNRNQNFCFQFFNIENTRHHLLYDYIRTLNLTAIRHLRKISLVIATGFLIATAVVIMSTAAKKETAVPRPANSGGSYDKKMQIEQEKKNTILRRFISYYQVSSILH